MRVAAALRTTDLHVGVNARPLEGKGMIPDISPEMMREQSRATRAFMLYICEHKELPPRDSILARHLARAWSCDTMDVQHIGLCNIGIDLIRTAVWEGAEQPSLVDAIQGFEIWLRASDAHRATFVSRWEIDEMLRAIQRKTPIVRSDPPKFNAIDQAHCAQCLRIERELYMRHRYRRIGSAATAHSK
jgi:hypothetical protein